MSKPSRPALWAGLWIMCVVAMAPSRDALAQASETAVYFGLNITLGVPDADPGLVVGVQQRQISADGGTAGMDLRLRLAPGRGTWVEDFRLSALIGVERAQMGLGMGYDFARKRQFTTLSLQTQSARVGLDSFSSARSPILWVEISPLRLARRTDD